MRSFITSILVFVCLAVMFSGCGGTTDPNLASGNDQSAANSPAGDEKTAASEFPVLPVKITEAEMEGVDHSLTKLSDRKGKVVLVNLWATWCGYCRIEMPHLVLMQDEYRDKGLEIIGLNADNEPDDEINEFASEMKLNYPLVRGDIKMIGDLRRISRNDAIPQSFLIDRDGRLRGVFLGAGAQQVKQMEASVAKVIAE